MDQLWLTLDRPISLINNDDEKLVRKGILHPKRHRNSRDILKDVSKIKKKKKGEIFLNSSYLLDIFTGSFELFCRSAECFRTCSDVYERRDVQRFLHMNYGKPGEFLELESGTIQILLSF